MRNAAIHIINRQMQKKADLTISAGRRMGWRGLEIGVDFCTPPASETVFQTR